MRRYFGIPIVRLTGMSWVAGEITEPILFHVAAQMSNQRALAPAMHLLEDCRISLVVAAATTAENGEYSFEQERASSQIFTL